MIFEFTLQGCRFTLASSFFGSDFRVTVSGWSGTGHRPNFNGCWLRDIKTVSSGIRVSSPARVLDRRVRLCYSGVFSNKMFSSRSDADEKPWQCFIVGMHRKLYCLVFTPSSVQGNWEQRAKSGPLGYGEWAEWPARLCFLISVSFTGSSTGYLNQLGQCWLERWLELSGPRANAVFDIIVHSLAGSHA